MDGEITRRRALMAGTVMGTASLAGCGFFGSDPDVAVFNRMEDEITVEVTLYEDRDEELTSNSSTIAPDEAFELDDVFPSSGQLTLMVAVEGGPSGEHTFDVSNVSSMQAYVEEDVVNFEEF